MQIRFLEQNPRYIGCAHRVRLVDEYGNPCKCQYLEWISRKQHYSLKDFKGIFLPGHGSTLVRRNIFLDRNNDYSVMWKASPWIGDRTSNLLFSSRGDFYKFDKVMSCYRYISKTDGTTVTSRIYHSVEAASIDYQYTCYLDKYARQSLNVNANFDFHKAELFVTELFQSIKFRCKLNDLAKTIFSDLKGNKLWPILVLQASFHKIKVKLLKKYPKVFSFANREC